MMSPRAWKPWLNSAAIISVWACGLDGVGIVDEGEWVVLERRKRGKRGWMGVVMNE